MACNKDDSDLDLNPDNKAVLVKGSIYGLVNNQTAQPLSDVLISIGTATTTTDENGYFSFKDIEINTRGSLVTAEIEGYFKNAKFVSSKENKRNFTKIKMIEKVLSGTVSSTSGGSVSTNGGATIELPANSVEGSDGVLYNGNVNVYATWLDPTSADLYQRMPGDLRATDTNEEQVQLTTFGMIGVELEGTAGEVLNLIDGQSATISLPVPPSLLSNAPATIPLWHFDEVSGYWLEDGEANLQGEKYVGQVSHFSFWNCDVPNSYIWLDGVVLGRPGFGVEGILVKITENSSGVVGFAVTDEDGAFGGYVPDNQELTLTILGNCEEELLTDQIDPFADDTSLPAYNLNAVATNFVTVSGKLVDCDNNPVTNGYFRVSYGVSSILNTDANGDFSGTINTCNLGTVEGTGYDWDNLKNSTPTTYDVNGIDELELGEISVCEDLSEYLTYTIDGNTFTVLDPAATFFNPPTNQFRINGSTNPSSSSETFVIAFTGTTAGTYTSFQSAMTGEANNVNYFVFCDQQNTSGIPNCSSFDINITTFENVGGFVIGTLDGTMENISTGISYPISAEFKTIIE